MMKYAVIVAGGSGQRMGSDIPKQFLLLKGKPILHYTLSTFLDSFADLQVILVLPEPHILRGENMVNSMLNKDRITIVAGGETRFHSVRNGLQHVQMPSIVFVHDGVRCLVNKSLIQTCYQAALMHGSAIPTVAATDSIRLVEGEKNSMIEREKVKIVQTPQTFSSELLLAAFKQEYNPRFTDEATVVEANGNKVHLVEGDYNNIKITRPIDLLIAENLLKETIS